MLKIDEFVVREGDTLFVDFQEWKYGNGVSVQDGDWVRFEFEGQKYIGKLFRFGKEESVFEIKSLSKVEA